ncbi:protein trichome birefringence-like 11 [Cryptomeria japonica]|uniref:protein trichome birefringence-like 11 n=1 Tax=Cryptomeria japonica TaxID=3369 RepID=UPI0027DAA17D|nr:protein trichome birefringence-like 11 [Cryptomeria japonica]
MKDLFGTKMDTNGGYGHPLRLPAGCTVSIHQYIWYATIFGLSAVLVVLSCIVYFDSGFGFLGPLKFGAVGSYNSSEGIVVAETGQIKELGGVGDYNSSERNKIGETRQQQNLGGVGDNSNGEGIMVNETGQQQKLGGVGDNGNAEGIMVNETGQQQKLGVVGGNGNGEGIMVNETGQQQKLGGVGDNGNGEGIMVNETGQQNSGEGIMGDETGQQKQPGDVRVNNSGEGFVGLKGEKKQLSECDLSVGMWVRDEAYPIYQSQNCPFMDSGFRCQENGRPDTDYLKWRWQPSDCDLPRFDPRKFLQSIQNRRIVFVGDSIGRNQWESMVCMLAEAVSDKTRIYEVNGNPITKHMGYLSFRFEDYNCTVEYYRAPFLVYQGRPPAGSPPEVRMTLKVDTLDYTSKLWVNGDILVFNTGHWWNYEKTVRWGCYFQEGHTVNIKLDIETAFQKSMNTWVKWVRQHVDSEKSHVFLRTYSPVHFRAGTWKTGGQCHEETWPDLKSSSLSSWKTQIMSEAIQHLQERKNVQSLNITYSAKMRKDGHPSIYYVGKENGPASIKKQDCSHWCLPGVPDQWNHLLYSHLIARGYGDLGTRVSRK